VSRRVTSGEGKVERLSRALDGELESSLDAHRSPIRELPWIVYFPAVLVGRGAQFPAPWDVDVIVKVEVPPHHDELHASLGPGDQLVEPGAWGGELPANPLNRRGPPGAVFKNLSDSRTGF
jgi:hypothetical protein